MLISAFERMNGVSGVQRVERYLGTEVVPTVWNSMSIASRKYPLLRCRFPQNAVAGPDNDVCICGFIVWKFAAGDASLSEIPELPPRYVCA